jgi:hypothetical protein
LLPCLNAPLAGLVTPNTLVRVLNVVTMPACRGKAQHFWVKHRQGLQSMLTIAEPPAARFKASPTGKECC